jgi:hypothetical protein
MASLEDPVTPGSSILDPTAQPCIIQQCGSVVRGQLHKRQQQAIEIEAAHLILSWYFELVMRIVTCVMSEAAFDSRYAVPNRPPSEESSSLMWIVPAPPTCYST